MAVDQYKMMGAADYTNYVSESLANYYLSDHKNGTPKAQNKEEEDRYSENEARDPTKYPGMPDFVKANYFSIFPLSRQCRK